MLSVEGENRIEDNREEHEGSFLSKLSIENISKNVNSGVFWVILSILVHFGAMKIVEKCVSPDKYAVLEIDNNLLDKERLIATLQIDPESLPQSNFVFNAELLKLIKRVGVEAAKNRYKVARRRYEKLRNMLLEMKKEGKSREEIYHFITKYSGCYSDNEDSSFVINLLYFGCGNCEPKGKLPAMLLEDVFGDEVDVKVEVVNIKYQDEDEAVPHLRTFVEDSGRHFLLENGVHIIPEEDLSGRSLFDSSIFRRAFLVEENEDEYRDGESGIPDNYSVAAKRNNSAFQFPNSPVVEKVSESRRDAESGGSAQRILELDEDPILSLGHRHLSKEEIAQLFINPDKLKNYYETYIEWRKDLKERSSVSCFLNNPVARLVEDYMEEIDGDNELLKKIIEANIDENYGLLATLALNAVEADDDYFRSVAERTQNESVRNAAEDRIRLTVEEYKKLLLDYRSLEKMFLAAIDYEHKMHKPESPVYCRKIHQKSAGHVVPIILYKGLYRNYLEVIEDMVLSLKLSGQNDFLYDLIKLYSEILEQESPISNEMFSLAVDFRIFKYCVKFIDADEDYFKKLFNDLKFYASKECLLDRIKDDQDFLKKVFYEDYRRRKNKNLPFDLAKICVERITDQDFLQRIVSDPEMESTFLKLMAISRINSVAFLKKLMKTDLSYYAFDRLVDLGVNAYELYKEELVDFINCFREDRTSGSFDSLEIIIEVLFDSKKPRYTRVRSLHKFDFDFEEITRSVLEETGFTEEEARKLLKERREKLREITP